MFVSFSRQYKAKQFEMKVFWKVPKTQVRFLKKTTIFCVWLKWRFSLIKQWVVVKWKFTFFWKKVFRKKPIIDFLILKISFLIIINQRIRVSKQKHVKWWLFQPFRTCKIGIRFFAKNDFSKNGNFHSTTAHCFIKLNLHINET